MGARIRQAAVTSEAEVNIKGRRFQAASQTFRLCRVRVLIRSARLSLFLSLGSVRFGMSVTVKAYLLGKDEQVKEIRRFAVDQEVSCSFEYLSRKVAAVFSNLSGSTCSLFYKGERHVTCTRPDAAWINCFTEKSSEVSLRPGVSTQLEPQMSRCSPGVLVSE